MTYEITQQVYDYLITKVGYTVFTENISPYTTRPQPGHLLQDIRSFSYHENIADSIYSTLYKPCVFYNDLIYYLLSRRPDSSGESTRAMYMSILHRFYKGKGYNDDMIHNMFNTYYCYHEDDERILTQLSRRIFGMMTPRERDEFICTFLKHDR